MSEPAKNPFEPFFEAIRAAVREEIRAAMNGNGTRLSEDRLLDAEEAAKILCVSQDWLYHHGKKLPFTRKLGPKLLRFSSQGIQRYLATRKPT